MIARHWGRVVGLRLLRWGSFRFPMAPIQGLAPSSDCVWRNRSVVVPSSIAVKWEGDGFCCDGPMLSTSYLAVFSAMPRLNTV
ncbi:hypothetical protein BRADI_2g05705v3 [Brachypodium distachyon]|uniref:Uncharacterized protein n=1 Tax=Brachypodium distachyon TaxID=15368 RepID=A0A2K2D755_BRADI|nr:hypothetical protein BRADI_2g05705v3 [Brachypodium distachyon]